MFTQSFSDFRKYMKIKSPNSLSYIKYKHLFAFNNNFCSFWTLINRKYINTIFESNLCRQGTFDGAAPNKSLAYSTGSKSNLESGLLLYLLSADFIVPIVQSDKEQYWKLCRCGKGAEREWNQKPIKNLQVDCQRDLVLFSGYFYLPWLVLCIILWTWYMVHTCVLWNNIM